MRLSVVVSQSPSKNPAKRKLEEDIVTGLLFENGIDVTVVPNLYDIKPDSTGMLALHQINGHAVVVSWLFERASHWILDRHGVHGHVGKILLQNEDEEDEDEIDEATEEADEKSRVIDNRKIPNRKIYCLDLKTTKDASQFIDEVKRIHKELSIKVVALGDVVNAKPFKPTPAVSETSSSLSPDTIERFNNPTNDTALAANGSGVLEPSIVNRIESTGGRRWYPVIDYSRCTNCMECIDFCLFGVYGVDKVDEILVEQPDNCRKGCPACSRVCPENAIMFPQHKTPAIAGSAEGVASMKIDLSQLFGAPADGKTADEIAAMERDEQLLAVGREAVGVTPKRSEQRESTERDALDDLVDQLDDFDV